MKEPTLLPTTFPNVLVSANQGIAVGMASNLCGFNLGEVCDTTIALLKIRPRRGLHPAGPGLSPPGARSSATRRSCGSCTAPAGAA